jgi:hypothetical protein
LLFVTFTAGDSGAGLAAGAACPAAADGKTFPVDESAWLRISREEGGTDEREDLNGTEADALGRSFLGRSFLGRSLLGRSLIIAGFKEKACHK